jgi:polyisoprenoid-binding protein YceI
MLAAVELDEKSASCEVFTFKEGLLSAIAHDLRVAVTRFALETDGASYVRGNFDARSLRVVAAQRNGGDDPRALSESDKRTIEGQIARDVLHADQWDTISFRSTDVAKEGDGFRVRGELTLAGRTRAIAFVTRADGDRQIADLTVHQPDFGIAPYRAMLGTLRVQADVRVRVTAKLA